MKLQPLDGLALGKRRLQRASGRGARVTRGASARYFFFCGVLAPIEAMSGPVPFHIDATANAPQPPPIYLPGAEDAAMLPPPPAYSPALDDSTISVSVLPPPAYETLLEEDRGQLGQLITLRLFHGAADLTAQGGLQLDEGTTYSQVFAGTVCVYIHTYIQYSSPLRAKKAGGDMCTGAKLCFQRYRCPARTRGAPATRRGVI